LEETGATIAIRMQAVCFIVPIADIHISNNSPLKSNTAKMPLQDRIAKTVLT